MRLENMQMPEVDEEEEDSEGAEGKEDLCLFACVEGCEEVIAESANLEGASSEVEKEAQGNDTRESL